MLPEQIKKFREVVTLREGVHVLLRPISADDTSHLSELFSALSDEDLRIFRHNVKDSEVVQSWCENIDYNEVLPILALVKDRAVGLITLHFFHGARRHIGEIRIFLAKDFRKRGLGMKMVRATIDLARKQGLLILIGEIIASQVKVIRAFEQLGFEVKCVLDDFFMHPDGDCADVVFLMMPLKPKAEEF
ncbi:MAG: GNAT family N-acetyltransferase [Chloroflexota bacterium]